MSDHPNVSRPVGEAPPLNREARILELRNQGARVVFNPKKRDNSGKSLPLIGRDAVPKSRESSPEIARTERRKQRNLERANPIGLQLRPEERKLLIEVGKFRVIAVADLARFLYDGEDGRLKRDLVYLRQNNLVDVHVLNARRDGRAEDARRFDAVTLTKAARKLVEQSGEIPEGQRVYSGLVKPREAEHDSQIYRAYLKELAKIEGEGGRNPRVKLDFELKASVQRAVYQARKAEPDRETSDIKREVAEQFDLTVINKKVVVPDACIEYDLPGGGSGKVDIEVATSAYRHSHLAGKARAGFRLYMPNGDIGRLGAAVQDDHDIMSEILDF